MHLTIARQVFAMPLYLKMITKGSTNENYFATLIVSKIFMTCTFDLSISSTLGLK